MRYLLGGFAALMICAGAASAHPHMFIDTGLEVDFNDQGLATGLRITWTYDDLSSMQILADMGLDMDMDGVLSEDELKQLDGFDMRWDDGIAGDTYAQIGAKALHMSRPKDWTVAYKDTRITSTHYRSFDAPVAVGPDALTVQVYDETMYTAYALVYDTTFTGRSDCEAELVMPDLDAAQAKLAAAIAALPTDVEVEYPALGADFAQGITVTCGAPS
jgi:ABC-type uncharacterized transport system substrate-binding protein